MFNFVFFICLLYKAVGFVPQDDSLLPNITVEEALMYSAHSRLSKQLSAESRAKIVEDVIGKLGLNYVMLRTEFAPRMCLKLLVV